IAAPILRYFYVQQQWRQQVQAESSARLQALQARIRPHFLFNSMNTIASLTRSRPEQAETAVENLADLFRASMNEQRLHRWQDEQLLCQRYLEIEAMRLGARLRVDWQVEALPADALLPPLVLQPLLENAIYHGIEPLAQGGVITIQGARQDGQLSLRVENPVADAESHHHRGNRLALENIRERITTLFGRAGTLQATQHDHHYSVTLSFPYRARHEDFDR
ncbi:MAG: histidine kinase, partial [Gammaproteobacteria bacterium]